MKPTYRKSWAGNLLIFSDLTLGPSFKVKQWFTGFGELSFRWIQICIGSPMRRSSYVIVAYKNYIFLIFQKESTSLPHSSTQTASEKRIASVCVCVLYVFVCFALQCSN